MSGSIEKLNEYGCPIAVYLYLRFLLEAALLFVLLSLLSTPLLLDSMRRNLQRDECRHEWRQLVLDGAAADGVLNASRLTRAQVETGPAP